MGTQAAAMIYGLADKRRHGYHGPAFPAWRPACAALDLKVDRQGGRLLGHAVHFEPHAPSDVIDAGPVSDHLT
jgi:uncharacterized protein YcaQ